jgi:hypothetical protein
VATGVAITALAIAGGFAATGCGDGTTSTTRDTSAQAAGVEEIVDQHPDVVTIVCQSTAAPGGAPQIEDRALGAIAPLAMRYDVPPDQLLDEFRNRC